MKANVGLLERYDKEIAGVLGCFDRLVVTGTLMEIAHPDAMDARLFREGFRAVDIGQLPSRCGSASGTTRWSWRGRPAWRLSIFRAPGASARRTSSPKCSLAVAPIRDWSTSSRWWRAVHDLQAVAQSEDQGQPGLRMQTGKCSTYYFYLIDPELGLMYVRVPTWLPCRLQIYFNVHHWLAAQLQQAGIAFKMEDNSFVEIADWERAQQLAGASRWRSGSVSSRNWRRASVPVLDKFPRGYHWTVMQVEYSLDLVFQRRERLAPLYEADQPARGPGGARAGHGPLLGASATRRKP